MNDPLNRVLLNWADSGWYWWPASRLRPGPERRLALSAVLIHTLSGASAAGLPVVLLARAWLGHWSLPAFLVPAGVGAIAAFVSATMVRLAWNRRAAEHQRGLAAGQPAPVTPRPVAVDAWLVQPAAFLAILGLAVALVTVEENVRGSFALRHFEAELRARHLPVTPADLEASAVPEDRNLAFAPIFRPLTDYTREPSGDAAGWRVVWRDPEGYARAQNMIFVEEPHASLSGFLSARRKAAAGGKSAKAADQGPSEHWGRGRRVDLANWRDYYRSLTNWPRTEAPQTPGRDVLTALSRWDVELGEIRAAAAARPDCRFPLRFDEGFEMLLPPLATVKRTAVLLRLRAVALLSEGRTDEALADTLLGLRMGEAVADEPILISALVRVAIDTLMLQPVWEGCLDRRWTEPQLVALQHAFAARDYRGQLIRALGGERVLAGVTYDALARRDSRALGALFPDGTDPSPGSFDSALRLYLTLSPRGWVRQNQVLHGRCLQGLADDLLAARSRRELPPEERHLDQIKDRGSPTTILAAMLVPAVGRAADKVYVMEAQRNLALVGLALERHRLATGKYPDRLAELAPKFLAEVPLDPMTAEPLKYVRVDDDYRLYSVGLGFRDDGGERWAAGSKHALVNGEVPDVVWR